MATVGSNAEKWRALPDHRCADPLGGRVERWLPALRASMPGADAFARMLVTRSRSDLRRRKGARSLTGVASASMATVQRELLRRCNPQ